MNINGFPYTFKANEHGHYVTQVNSREHREHLLSLKNFVVYEPPKKRKAKATVKEETQRGDSIATDSGSPEDHPRRVVSGGDDPGVSERRTA
jgi:hypothetical protein